MNYHNNQEYRILDSELNSIGVLKIGGKTEFFNDTITHQIADADQSSSSYGESPAAPANESNPNINAESKNFDHSGSISVLQRPNDDSDKVVDGNCLAYFDESQNRWYVMKIWHTEESIAASGAHVITAQLVNLGLWDLHYRLTKAKKFTNATAKSAFYWLLQDMDWNVNFDDLEDWNYTANVEFTGNQKSSSMLQTLLQAYDLECDFYVEYKGNYVSKKIFKVSPELDSDYYGEAYVGKNVTAISRITNGDIITRLMVLGPNGETMANAKTYKSGVVSHDSGSSYVYDESANNEYGDGEHWLDGVITSENITDANGLMMYGMKILKLYNHPRISYTVQCTHDFNPKLGATIRTKDFYARPEITTTQRVISRTFSFANPSENTVSFGEFVTVKRITPSWLSSFTSNIQQALQAAKTDASNISTAVLTPDGTDFKGSNQTKRFIIQAWSMGTNISGYVDAKGFEFMKFKADTIDVSGTLSDAQIGQYEKTLTGYYQELKATDVGYYRADIDNDYLIITPEVMPNEAGVKSHYMTLPNSCFGVKAAAQYTVKLSDGSVITSYALKDDSNSLDSHKDDVGVLHLGKDGSVKGSMRIASGGHGSCFGVQEIDSNNVYLYMHTYNFDSSNAHDRFTRIKFPINTLNQKVTDITTSRDDFKIGYSAKSGDYFYPAVDLDKGYGVILHNNGWVANVCKLSDIMAGNENILYSISLKDYGFDDNKQTFQSCCFKYPYFMWQSGDYDMHDNRVVYGVNVLHKGQVFELNYNFIDYFDIPGVYDVIEPEALSVDGNNLFVSFNCDSKVDKSAVYQGYAYEIPLQYRT